MPGPENGPVTLSDFAKYATQERLESTTEDSQKSADQKLQSLFQINQILNSSGIDTARQISLDPNDDIQIGKDALLENKIQINGKTITLSAQQQKVYAVLQAHEGNKINHRDIAKLIPGMDTQKVGGVILALRTKIEDDPRHPKYLIGTRGGYGVGGITFIKTPNS